MESVRVEDETNFPVGRFSALPAEILIAIVGFLSPYDILALRTVSKLMSSVARERGVWIEALRYLCIQYDIYPSSFRFPEMSLDELEHAATAWRRFSAHLRSEFSLHRQVWPHSIQNLEPRDMGEEFENMRFIPGGRFLVTTDKTTLKLWDLGNLTNFSTGDAIASLEIAGATGVKSLRTRASHSSPDALVIVSTTGSDFRVHVFTIFPVAPNPEFTPYASPLILSTFDDHFPFVLGANSSHVILETPSSRVLWDFIHDAWVGWPHEPTRLDDTVYLCNNNIVTIHADEAQLYVTPLPGVFPRSVFALPPKLNSPDLSQRYPLCRFNQSVLNWCLSGMTLVFHGRENITVDKPLHIDILSREYDKVVITHHALVPNTSSNTNESDTSGPYMLPTPRGEPHGRCIYFVAHPAR
ncbi:F-box domain-containing protein [Mycena sanguinolenta]|uniref:F-box domain-containing protein n=1 Tax=Mycena sanguinolenta TaxID=230812 RepID=A0A8H6XRW2_9AGAR|nr:F-box domain-containing protein [Mycena sanguinolenta]